MLFFLIFRIISFLFIVYLFSCQLLPCVQVSQVALDRFLFLRICFLIQCRSRLWQGFISFTCFYSNHIFFVKAGIKRDQKRHYRNLWSNLRFVTPTITVKYLFKNKYFFASDRLFAWLVQLQYRAMQTCLNRIRSSLGKNGLHAFLLARSLWNSQYQPKTAKIFRTFSNFLIWIVIILGFILYHF